MENTSKHAAWVALMLGISLSLQSIIFLAVEPRMGFTSMADYWNPVLVVPALNAKTWLVSDLSHLLNSILLIILANMLANREGLVMRLLQSFGIVAGGLFLLVVMLDRIGAMLPSLIQDAEMLSFLSIGYVSVRMGALFAAVFAFGAVILLISGENLHQHWYATWFSYIGFLIGGACIIFFVLPLPIPLLLSIWALGLGVLLLRGRRRSI